MAFDTQYTVLIGRVVESLLKTGNEIWCGFGIAVDADNVQTLDDFLICVVVHEIVLAAFIEDEI